VQRLADVAVAKLITDEHGVVIRVLEHGRGGSMAEQMWPGRGAHFDHCPIALLGL